MAENCRRVCPIAPITYVENCVTELQQKRMENKLRIRYINTVPNEDTKTLVLSLLNKNLFKIDADAIVSCTREKCLDDFESPMDIVVCFTHKNVRDWFYETRKLAGSPIMTEEMGKSLLKIYKRALSRYGRHRVSVCGGAVKIRLYSGEEKHIRSFTELKMIIERETQLLNQDRIIPYEFPECT